MSHDDGRRRLSRRAFLKYAGGAALVAATAGLGAGPRLVRDLAGPASADAAPGPNAVFLELAGTDGWISLPKTPAIPPYHPDTYAPDGFTTYVFGFRNVSQMNETDKFAQKNHAQHSAPLLWVDEYDASIDNTLFVKLTNLGLAQRPDLFDEHTLHWHGFKNQIPYYDGEPTGSISVPAGRTFQYAYKPKSPGTYMYHCHVEDTEHVHMGMTGMVFVLPKQNGTPIGGFTRFAYNDGDGSTGYDREYSMFLSEVWAEAHWADAHIQLPEWSDYRPDFALLNGRVYPETVLPSTVVNPHPGAHATKGYAGTLPATYRPYEPGGDLPSHPLDDGRDLQYQPLGSLITANAGERVLLRFANLGFTQQTMTLTGMRARIVGRDASQLKGRTGVSGAYVTDSITIGAGESVDAIVEIPAYRTGSTPNVYMLFNREYRRSNNLAPGGFGGQATEIHVYPANTLAPQAHPHQAVTP